MGVGIYSLYVECDYPRWMSWALILYMISFLVLFGNFYLQSYIKKSKLKDGTKVANGHTEEPLQNGSHSELRKKTKKE